MKRIKKVFTLIHLVVWKLLALLIGLQLWTEGDPNWRALTVSTLLTCLYVFYSHFYILTHYQGKARKVSYYFRLLFVILTGPLPFVLFHPRAFASWGNFSDYYAMTLASAVPLFLFLSWLARITENLVLNTIRKEQLEKQAVEAELYYLKSQINPHFLFNTLNNIHTLVYKQAPAAPEAVQRLSSLMRYMIYESNAALVPLVREIDYLRDYIGLQQLRYKNSPVVDLKVQGEFASCHIAPLLFIHLLENAYKHSPARLEAGQVKVKVEVNDNTLIFSIQNPSAKNPGNSLEEPGGIGLPNVRKRLALLYPQQHSLEVSHSDELFTIVLHIQGLKMQSHDTKTYLLHH
ncbi:sensor histidine kinase [Arundinibacter roseus]|uniref:Sensor histidine kinase n=1 Tax=Arundinibacter roseus TaxID=2070510 RepID=A0A4R4JXN2_9BACT|nr:histidine kinase [Arundinibacter roseus]TDB59548.1 sensor histidine kinase [Arundinibacter roseus]